ncbi:SDR family NAD(P)-dependent oxidoreductase [Roseivirga seohaensis]|uniref:SDR family NAD(P)-dependent oxidoreductase n=1 Tax=Roseivirga seohaensis TaxID=1914963 RepID=UPI00069CC24D|nr:SDR family NAD(P)-dependent oxidoreductase [Roseivirga seohaensis]
MTNSKKFALVTGSSNGIGRAIAENCAARGFNVLLVALPEPKLEEVTNALATKYPNQEFHCLGVNLMDAEAPQEVFQWCQKNNFVVDILANNAGLGNSGDFLSKKAEFYFGQMQLNMVAMVMLTHHFLPEMQKLDKAYILNVASMASYYDIPFKGIYAASKKFVSSFSHSLRYELKDSNVFVSILCPAAVLTNPEVIKRDANMGFVSKITRQTAEQVAEYALSRMFNRKPVSIPGVFPKFYRTLGRVIPHRMQLRMLANAFIKQSRE